MKEAIGFAQCQAECDSLGERGNRKPPVIGAQVLKFQHAETHQQREHPENIKY